MKQNRVIEPNRTEQSRGEEKRGGEKRREERRGEAKIRGAFKTDPMGIKDPCTDSS